MMKTVILTSLLICLLLAISTESRRKGSRHYSRHQGSRHYGRQSGPPCEQGVRVHNCFLDPCMIQGCDEPPDTECRSNYCGGCNAHFYLNDTKVPCTQPGPPRWNYFRQRTRRPRQRTPNIH